MPDVVHIGYHKTASTWFQKRYYPRVASHGFVERGRVKDAFLRVSALQFEPARAIETVRAQVPRGPMILCEEELSGNPHSGGLFGCLSKDVATRLHATVPEAFIVIFLREQREAIAACYKQYVRAGGTHRLARYLHPHVGNKGVFASAYKAPRFSLDHFDYAALVEHYIALFGRDQVHVFLYENFREDAGAFLEGFAKQLGLNVEPGEGERGRENVSYGRRTLALARAINHLSARNVVDKHYWVDWIPNSLRRNLLERVNRSFLSGAPPDTSELLAQTPSVKSNATSVWATAGSWRASDCRWNASAIRGCRKL